MDQRAYRMDSIMREIVALSLLLLIAAPASAGKISLVFDINVESRGFDFTGPSDPSFVPRHVSTTVIIDDRSVAPTNQAHLSYREYGPVEWTTPFASELPARPSGVVTAVGIQSFSTVHSYLRLPDLGSLFALAHNEQLTFNNTTSWIHYSSLGINLTDRPSLGILDGFTETNLLQYLEELKTDKVSFVFHEDMGTLGPGSTNPKLFHYWGTALLTSIQVQQVPEPAAVLQVIAGLLASAMVVMRRRQLSDRPTLRFTAPATSRSPA